MTHNPTCMQVRNSQESVVINASEEWVATMREHNVGAGGYLVAGATTSTLQQTLDHLHGVRVLYFQGLRPGAFGGHDSHDKDMESDYKMAAIWDGFWYSRYALKHALGMLATVFRAPAWASASTAEQVQLHGLSMRGLVPVQCDNQCGSDQSQTWSGFVQWSACKPEKPGPHCSRSLLTCAAQLSTAG